ncbi:MAG TPA: AI-2E family transporter [Candidatus Krumholzibacteria bacterium]|nr:AI-2E family transporter [Candidatus Krumholzibacteria bacterium]HPD72874.1 AI-2E family transporter [Candidatus Krumholzibacteria bacterium]HRY41673.1 AI-2E family transporter [Candidatus Krumholzibacteria bacterium]
MSRETVNRIVLLALVIFISVMFVRMVKGFLLALLMAAILAGLLNRLYDRLTRVFRGRKALAAVTTEVLLVLLILIPLAGLVGLVTAQAIKVGGSVGPWIRDQLSQTDALTRRLEALPFYDQIAPYREEILTRVGSLAGSASNWLVGALGDATVGTVHFVFLFFVMIYALYFFLIHGRSALDRILWYLPLAHSDEQRMLARFLSVTRATLKGTGLIGLLQGTLGGLGFAVAGIESAAFWGAVMMLLSVIPGLGTAVVWVPAVVWFAMSGHWGAAIALSAYFVLVVGLVDNLLRPRVVGRDTQMPDLLVSLSTLGGLSLFGALGFIIGPIVGALFVTVWEIYGETFRDLLPNLRPDLAGRTRGPDSSDPA